MGGFSTPLTEKAKYSGQKISKDIAELNNTANQLDFSDDSLLHPRTIEYTFFSTSRGTFIKIEHILSHKTYINKFKRMEVI